MCERYVTDSPHAMELKTRTTRGRPADSRKDSPTFGEKRPCAERGCITLLHRYHPGDYCYVHEAKRCLRRLTPGEEMRELMGHR